MKPINIFKVTSSFLTVVFLFHVKTVHSETLTAEQQKALNGAIEELTNPEKRSAAIKNSPKAIQSDQMVKQVGGEHSEEIYQLAAKVMESLAAQAEGDPDKMDKILEKAQKDPEAFAKTFSPEQRKMLNDISKKVEQSKNQTLH